MTAWRQDSPKIECLLERLHSPHRAQHLKQQPMGMELGDQGNDFPKAREMRNDMIIIFGTVFPDILIYL